MVPTYFLSILPKIHLQKIYQYLSNAIWASKSYVWVLGGYVRQNSSFFFHSSSTKGIIWGGGEIGIIYPLNDSMISCEGGMGMWGEGLINILFIPPCSTFSRLQTSLFWFLSVCQLGFSVLINWCIISLLYQAPSLLYFQCVMTAFVMNSTQAFFWWPGPVLFIERRNRITKLLLLVDYGELLRTQ